VSLTGYDYNCLRLRRRHWHSALGPFTVSAALCVLQEVRKAQAANRARLDEEYRRLVGNLVEAQQLRGGEEWLANPALPEDIVRESMPGQREVPDVSTCKVVGCLQGCRVLVSVAGGQELTSSKNVLLLLLCLCAVHVCCCRQHQAC